MDFGIIEVDTSTDDFWSGLQAWLDDHATPAMVARWRAGGDHDPAFHAALGAQGWVLAARPVGEGGAGLGELEQRILGTELARRCVPSLTRDTTLLVLPVIDRWMDGERRADLLRQVAAGQVCFCLGYTEPEAGSDLSAVRTRAWRDGEEWTISGQKLFTTGAHHCQYSFVLARTDPDAPTRTALTTFLVPLDAPGVELQAVQTLSGERTNVVFYDEVRITDDLRLGPVGDGWAIVHGPLNVEHRMAADGPRAVEEEEGEAGGGQATDISSYILGVHESAVGAARDWAEAAGPDGRRPIDDPVVRRQLARIELRLAVARVTPGPQGRVCSADSIIRNTAELLDLLGPDGLVAGSFVEYAHRFAQGTAIYGGTTDVFRTLIAERFLGLSGRNSRRV